MSEEDMLGTAGAQGWYLMVRRNQRFLLLVAGIMFFFGCHNYLQEYIMHLPGFHVGVFLGYLEVLGVTVCAAAERQISGKTERVSPWSSYAALCVCLVISSATSNIALSYINYPTKVVFRSCKLIPTMLIARVYNKRQIPAYEFGFGVLISVGMIVFAVADFNVSPDFDFTGIVLVCISVAADAFLPNLQERVFENGSSRVEVTYFTNLLTLASMTTFFTMTGDIQEAVSYALLNRHAMAIMSLYTFLAYIAISFHMTLVQEYGGIATVLVGNTRKALTIVLSFILFPKPMSYLYVVGGMLVFGSLISIAVIKERQRSIHKRHRSDLEMVDDEALAAERGLLTDHMKVEREK
jgi:adenosine 3'-phospho 5'-phosphosulfate transporter B3